MVAALFTGIAQGLNQWDKEAKQIRLDNMRAFNEQVRMAAELGMAPDPAELSKMAEGITGGSNWQMAALPGEELRRGISERLVGIKQAREAQSQLTVLQTTEANERYFTGVVSDHFMANGKDDDLVPSLEKRFSNSPVVLQKAKDWLGGKDLKAMRGNVYAQEYKRLEPMVTLGDTEQSVRAKFPNIPLDLQNMLVAKAKTVAAAEAQRNYSNILSNVTTMAANGVFLAPEADGTFKFNPESFLKAGKALGLGPDKLNDLLPIVQQQSGNVARTRAQNYAEGTARLVSAEGQAFRTIVDQIAGDASLVSAITANGMNFNIDEAMQSLQKAMPNVAMLKDRPTVERIVANVREMVFQNQVKNWTDNAAKAVADFQKDMEKAQGGWLSANREAIQTMFAKMNNKDINTPNMLKALDNSIYLTRPGEASVLAKQVWDGMSREERSQTAAAAEKIARELVKNNLAMPLDRAVEIEKARRVMLVAGQQPMEFSRWAETGGPSQARARVEQEFEDRPEDRLSNSPSLQVWNARHAALRATVKYAIEMHDKETSRPSLLKGYDPTVAANSRAVLEGYLRQLNGMTPPPDLPADERERQRRIGQGGGAAPPQARPGGAAAQTPQPTPGGAPAAPNAPDRASEEEYRVTPQTPASNSVRNLSLKALLELRNSDAYKLEYGLNRMQKTAIDQRIRELEQAARKKQVQDRFNSDFDAANARDEEARRLGEEASRAAIDRILNVPGR
jgi:hypothetical protein